MRGNTLVINYVDETDNGRYSCQTFNDYDRRGQRAEYMLNVIGRDPSGSIDESILLALLVPPRLSPIAPIKVNLDENTPPQRAVFTCRILRGATDNLNLEWLLADGTPVQVQFDERRDMPNNDMFSFL